MSKQCHFFLKQTRWSWNRDSGRKRPLRGHKRAVTCSVGERDHKLQVSRCFQDTWGLLLVQFIQLSLMFYQFCITQLYHPHYYSLWFCSCHRYCFPFGRPEGALKATLSLLERVMIPLFSADTLLCVSVYVSSKREKGKSFFIEAFLIKVHTNSKYITCFSGYCS